jgi:hypothetical protein
MSLLKTQYLKLTNEEGAMLDRLLSSSKDDPRIHGLIGTCLWTMGHTPEEEANVKALWTSLQSKVKEAFNDQSDG